MIIPGLGYIYEQSALEICARRPLLLMAGHWKFIACFNLLIQCGTIKGEAAREESQANKACENEIHPSFARAAAHQILGMLRACSQAIKS